MKISSWAFIIFFSCLGFSGGSTVRNGGGLGEMAAVMVFKRMSHYLSPCLNHPAEYALQENEIKVLAKLLNSLETEYQSYQLSFYVEGQSDFQTEPFIGSPIRLRSGALADDNGNPHRLSTIGALVLHALLLHQNEKNAAQLAAKIFSHLSVDKQSMVVNSSILHWLKIQLDAKPIFDEILLEQDANSNDQRAYDLRPLIESTGLCQNAKNLQFQIQNISTRYLNAPLLLLELKWGCSDQKFGTAKVELNLAFDESDVFSLQQSKAGAFGVIKPN